MTVYITSAGLEEAQLYFNIANIDSNALYDIEITSQYSHQPLLLANALISTNARYTHFQVQFPAGFSEDHKNGIYNWSIKYQNTDTIIQAGLMKIITNPGGLMWTKSFDAGTTTEERVSEVFYRPQYT